MSSMPSMYVPVCTQHLFLPLFVRSLNFYVLILTHYKKWYTRSGTTFILITHQFDIKLQNKKNPSMVFYRRNALCFGLKFRFRNSNAMRSCIRISATAYLQNVCGHFLFGNLIALNQSFFSLFTIPPPTTTTTTTRKKSPTTALGQKRKEIQKKKTIRFVIIIIQ